MNQKRNPNLKSNRAFEDFLYGHKETTDPNPDNQTEDLSIFQQNFDAVKNEKYY